MGSSYRKTKRMRKRKERTTGKDRRSANRNHGTTPSLDSILGPLSE